MIWIAPSAKDDAEQTPPALPVVETELDRARPAGLLGLSFLRFAEVRFTARRARVKAGYDVPG